MNDAQALCRIRRRAPLTDAVPAREDAMPFANLGQQMTIARMWWRWCMVLLCR